MAVNGRRMGSFLLSITAIDPFKKVTPPRTNSTRCPTILSSQRKAIEVALVCEYEMLWPEMFSNKHFICSSVILIPLNRRPGYLWPHDVNIMKHDYRLTFFIEKPRQYNVQAIVAVEATTVQTSRNWSVTVSIISGCRSMQPSRN